MKKIISIAAVSMMSFGILAGCSVGSSSSEDTDTKTIATKEDLKPFGKYKETVTYTVGKSTPGIAKLPPGQTYEENAYTKYLKETLNIQSKNKFEAQDGDAYKQKVSMAVASGDLPDIMAVDAATLRQLVDNDLIADLTDVYKSSASDYVKDMYDSYDGRALDAATFDGNLMALPSTQNANIPTMLWLRQDWLDKLGLKGPKTVDDVEKILTEFVQKDPGGNGKGNTVGLALAPSIGGMYGSLFQADNILQTYHSFPRQWIEQDGKVVYGSITKETKQGLGKLADWYKKGLIDPQLAVRKSIEDLVIGGQTGAYFGPWWTPDYPLNSAKQKIPNAEWAPYIISKDGSGTITAYTQNPASEFYVVRKGFKHPEVLPKLVSALDDKLRREDRNYQPVVDFIKFGGDRGAPVNIMVNFNDATAQMYENINAAIEGKKDPNTLSLDDLSSYQKITDYLKDPTKADANQWSAYNSRMVAGKLMAETKINEVNPVFFGQTKSMKLKWANLTKLEDEAFLKIVTGEKDLDYFDKFVENWKKTGGTEITKEVSEAIKEK
ncbi:carbohydrate ABC transporter substrate-binding protein (CUT1 family) [Neobacillus bataviensis]|uniref:Carbohydrate ABC transporter substrate-binding protein (CUT1 family) n=1 Tax=Neobacillus bataviensis TaxID=220685 RepID=A0A561CQC0_9BACI|nr:extracellular solute-binding protein [Neobacillus bataviensis]TWD93406.1 carbohydrate ABC transporter substrate-binding protein (CUT1 family) [Neobacillus bataviensis]